jgi:cell division protein FtsI (penicillin-binding protein 3)
VRDTHEHDILTVREIISYSSNIGAIKIGETLGYDRYVEYLKKFGFGEETGIGLLGERKGFVRPSDRSRPIDRATMFFGQGMTATSLQLAMAMAAIANGGNLMRPYVVREVVDESGKVVFERRPTVVRRVLSEKTALRAAGILEGVVQEKGTGSQAAIAGFTVAGKTGTAQKVDPKTRAYSNTKYIAGFIGFAPVVRPRLLILVVVDEPKGVSYGGVVAAPVFREVGRWSLNHLRVTPEIRLVESKPGQLQPVVSEATPIGKKKVPTQRIEAGLLPDFKGLGMREVLRKGRALGLDVRMEGTGLAIQQDPRPGLPLTEVKSVRVSFEPPV